MCLAAMYRAPLYNVETLLEHGAEMNSQNPRQIAPLAIALEAGHIDMAALLISKGARVDTYHPEVAGNLTVICAMHRWKGLKLLLSCNPELRSLFTGRTPTGERGETPGSSVTFFRIASIAKLNIRRLRMRVPIGKQHSDWAVGQSAFWPRC